MIFTSNRGFAEWGTVFGDPVVATAPPRTSSEKRDGQASSPGLRRGPPPPYVLFPVALDLLHE
jgi:hypothetical protein